MRIRIGTVGYLNAQPIVSRIDATRYDVVQDVPGEVGRALVAGEVDIALAPVASFLTSGSDLRVVPGVAIGGFGPVHSVLVVAETPPEQWTELLLDGESRTSAALVRILIERGPLGDRVQDLTIRTIPPGTAREQAVGTVAALVIGDAARDLPDRLTERIDLCELWRSWTGLPFVFAVWAGRPDLPGTVLTDLRDAARVGRAAIDSDYSGDDHTYVTQFIRYDLDDLALCGLRRFAALGAELGLFATRDVVLYGPERDTVARGDVGVLLAGAVDGQRLSWRDGVKVLAEGRPSEILAAADLRRQGLHPDNTVRIAPPRTLTASSDGILSGDGVAAIVVERPDPTELVRLLLTLRDVQDRTGELRAVTVHGGPRATGIDLLQATAMARLLLDNVPSIEADPSIGMDIAQTALRAGADALGPDVPGDVERWVRELGFRLPQPVEPAPQWRPTA